MIKIFFGVLSNGFLKSLLPILIVPIYIKYWGDQDYSVWLESIAATSILMLLGLGLNNFGINRAQIAYKKKLPARKKIYDTLLSLNLVIYIAVCFISILFLSLLNYFLKFESLFLVYMFGLYNAANILYSYISASFRIIEKFHVGLYFSLIQNIILYIGIIYFVTSGFSLLFISFWMTFLYNLSFIILLYLLKNTFGLKYRFRFSFRAYRLYIENSYRFLYFPLGDYFRINAPILFFAKSLAPLQLIIYSLNRTLANIQSKVLIILHATIIQKVTSNFANGNKIDPALIYKICFCICVPILTIFSFSLVDLYESIFHLWIGNDYREYLNVTYIQLLLINSFIYCVWNIGTIFLVGTNNFEKLSILSLIHGIGFISFGIIGFYLFNTLGFLLGNMVGEIFFGLIVINHEVYKKIKINFKDIFQLVAFTFINIFTVFMLFLLLPKSILSILAATLFTIALMYFSLKGLTKNLFSAD